MIAINCPTSKIAGHELKKVVKESLTSNSDPNLLCLLSSFDVYFLFDDFPDTQRTTPFMCQGNENNAPKSYLEQF